MASIFSDYLHNRIMNDVSAYDEAGYYLQSILDTQKKRKPEYATNDRGAILDMLDILGIKNAILNDNNDVFNQFKEILAANSYAYTVVKLEGKWWKTSSGPMLGVMKDDGTLSPLLPKGFNYYYGNTRINSRNADKMEPYAFCFFRTLPAKKLSIKEFLAFTTKSIPRFHLMFVVLLSVVIAGLSMLLPYATKLVFDQVIPSGEKSSIVALALVLINTALAIGLLSTVRTNLFIGVKNIIAVNSQASLFERLFRLKPAFFRKESAGTINAQVLGASQACENFSEGMVTVVFTFLVSLVYIIQIGVYSQFTPIFYAIIGVQALNMLCIWLAFVEKNKKKMKWAIALSRFYGLIHNYLQGIQKIKTNGAEARAFRNWADKYRYTIVFTIIESTLSSLTGTFNILSILLIVLLVPSTSMSVSDFAAFFSAFYGLSTAITQLGSYSTDFTYILPALNKIKPILEAEPEVEDNTKIVRDLTGNISVTDLSFKYPDGNRYIFKDLSFNINPGEYVALVGHSGCGKSTLLRLMLGFETPESGSIFYDQWNVLNVNKSSLRNHLGTCLQGGKLFSGTIFENVTISNPYATEDEVWEALRIAAIDEDVRKMPGGLYHKLDVNGQGVSGGQRQRILIARAVLNKPAVLFLDEATSALDNISQAKVIENLGKIRCTRITIAHRLSTIKNCDRIIVIDNGTVAEEGTYDELMSRQGIFADIAKRQVL